MIQTCKKCGAINQGSAEKCCFCEEALGEGAVVAVSAAAAGASVSRSSPRTLSAPRDSWRDEISSKLRSYRARRRNGHAEAGDEDESQSALPFEAAHAAAEAQSRDAETAVVEVELDDPLQTALAGAAASLAELEHSEPEAEAPAESPDPEPRDSREPRIYEQLVIDVSRPPEPDFAAALRPAFESTHSFAHPSSAVPVADLSVRRRAFLVDAGCVLVAFSCVLGLYLGFGGRLLATKLDLLICVATLTLLYTQYFTLFTVMGGATPGMMFTGLRVVSFEGEAPAPSRLLWRSFGYLVSGVPALLGFCWALADEDRLTCHDRISQTYIARAYAIAQHSGEQTAAAHGD